MGIEKAQRQFRIAVHWIAFPLHPETPPEGLPLKEIFAARVADLPQMAARLRQVAEGLGLPWADRTKTYNSRRAQELARWAEEKGQGEAFHRAVFQAYFAEAKNISRPAVLAGIVKALGLSEQEAREVMKKRPYRQAVDDDWELARDLGITSVPTYVLDREAVVGAQSYEALERFLLEKGVQRRLAQEGGSAAGPTGTGKPPRRRKGAAGSPEG